MSSEQKQSTSTGWGYQPELVLVHKNVLLLPMTQRILQALSSVPHKTVEGVDSFMQEARQSRQPYTQGKKTLYITEHQGRVLKPCQGMCGNVSCCLYYVVDFACNCPLDCSYCLLQSYLNNPLNQVYANTDAMLAELGEELERRRDRFFRVGTGELTDSLALDRFTRLSQDLVEFFACRPNAILELKTKTIEINNLCNLNHQERTVVSWSLNTPRIIDGEETGATTLEERLQAAKLCSDWGYPVGFHFDPLVFYPGWEKEYRETVEQLFDVMHGRKIVWISMGAFRCPAGLLEILRERFPQSRLPLGELVPGVDGKLRYFRPLRVELFRNMASWIHERSPGQVMYLCMESPRVWEQVFGFRVSADDVARRLDAAIWP